MVSIVAIFRRSKYCAEIGVQVCGEGDGYTGVW